ncbi:hypothetical protein CHS0354_032874 [Potamilus streckersoni]|uniref:Uncharacterized protein n=1 Tax=Potamilus streckersoni TaxID=2493646 RepID=A0AAE0W5W2_9BIVA|nr:hypothetical protein CHS0354_032874 [Potamilus streckersoni]
MKLQFIIALTSVSYLLFGTCVCFRIRRRSAEFSRFEDPYALSNAYQSLDRQRRRISAEEGLGNILLSSGVNYLKQPYDTDDIMDYLTSENPQDRFSTGDYYNLPIYERVRDLKEDNKEEFPYLLPYNNEDALQAQKRTFRTPYTPQRVKPSISELEDVFGSQNVPIKRLAPVRRSGPLIQAAVSEAESLLDENEKLSEADTQLDDNVELIQTMKELLQKVENVDKSKLPKDGSETDSSKPIETIQEIIKVKTDEFPLKNSGKEGSTIEASKQELDEIFGGNNESDDESVIPLKVVEEHREEILKQATNGNDFVPVEEKEETIVKEVESLDDSGSSKAKRGVNEDVGKTELNVDELLTTILALNNEVSRLRLLQVLEDKENDYLASALQQATLEQLENNENYLKDEYDDINRATETEELIQILLQKDEPDETTLSGPDDYDNVSDLVEEYLEPSTADVEEKRSERPSLVDIADDREKIQKWYEEPVKEEVQGAELERSPGNEQLEDIPDQGLPEVDTGGNDFAQENNSPSLINRVLAGLRPEEIAKLAAVYQRRDTCPVEKLSTNCAFADKLHLPIDADARILCNRHEVCYTCGQTIGLTESGCDKGYEGEIIQACGNDVNCLKDALLFLSLMKENHVYETYDHGICNAPCIQDYIYGFL